MDIIKMDSYQNQIKNNTLPFYIVLKVLKVLLAYKNSSDTVTRSFISCFYQLLHQLISFSQIFVTSLNIGLFQKKAETYLRTYFFEPPSPCNPGFFRVFTLLWEIPDKTKLHPQKFQKTVLQSINQSIKYFFSIITLQVFKSRYKIINAKKNKYSQVNIIQDKTSKYDTTRMGKRNLS